MDNKVDRRVRMTKNLLKSALIELLKTKSIYAVTVKELCENSEMNRSTFYRHYETVFDVYNDIMNDLINDIGEIVKSAKDSGKLYGYRLIESILVYIEHNKEEFLVLLSDNSAMGLGKTITDNADKIMALNDNEHTELSRYIIQFVTGGLTNIVWIWLNDENRLSPHNLALVVNTMLNSGLKRAIRFSTQVNLSVDGAKE